MSVPRAVLASGSGRYADPWHPFAETTAALADVLGSAGFRVERYDDVDLALTRLDGAALLAVNAGDPWRGEGSEERVPAASRQGLEAALARGVGVLAMHTSVSSLRDYPAWAPAVGAVWLPGLSFHPPRGETRVTGGPAQLGAVPVPHEGFALHDERYTRLQLLGERTVLATHAPEGDAADDDAAVWVREHGDSRVAVDVLGHGPESYASREHRALIAALARWAARLS